MSDIDVAILKQEILSLLVSAKDGLNEQELLNDYRMFNSNQDIPYRDLGYPSLVALLRTWPDVCRFRQQGNGQMKILAVEEENTKHILSMVRGQRPSKTKRQKSRGKSRSRGGREPDRYSTRENRGGKFVQQTFNSTMNNNSNNNRRMMSSNNRANSSSSSHSRNKFNNEVPPRHFKQQQQIRAYSQTQFYDDRRIINSSSSLKVTVANHNQIHEDYPTTPDTPFSLGDYELNGEEEEDREEEVINNIQNLLKEYPHGIRLLTLDNLYQQKFGKSLLFELKLANILLLQDYVDEFAEICRHDEQNGSCDHIIILRDPNQVAQTQAQLLKQITDSGIVPSTFHYANNLFSYINDARFQGFVSDIDKNEHCIHVQPVRYQEHIETLMEELDSYYSSPISNSLLIRDLEAGLSCVTKYDGIYHRVFIKELDPYKCVLAYVDYGTTEEVNRGEQQFKYLLKHFAELPAMCLACRLDDVYFLPNDTQWPENAYNEVYMLCQRGPFFIEPKDYFNGLLTIKILDADERSLNDIVIESKLAVRISDQIQENSSQVITPQSAIDNLSRAAECPLPDTCSSSSDISTDNLTQQHQYKLVQINKQLCFYLIRSNNKPYIPCFNLARILNITESDILSDTSLPRIRFCQTEDNSLVFDYFNQLSDVHDCLHIQQQFFFLFELLSVQKHLEQFGNKYLHLIEILHQQNQAATHVQFWSNNYTCQTVSSNDSGIEQYNDLLTRRRNILSNMLHTNDIHQCTIELESIENQLQKLVEKMKLGSIPKQNPRFNSSSPPSSSSSCSTSQDKQTNKKTDKLRDLMQRCKKLINTILVLDDYVIIDDNITQYIQDNLPLLNSSKASQENEQLYEHYSNLLTNLTLIVDNLRQQLPTGMPS